MLAPKLNLPSDQRQLVQLYKSLNQQDRSAVIAFAQFLSEKAQQPPLADAPLAEPKPIPRPQQETVISAIRRLSESYFMLDRSDLLNSTSSLMTDHILRGREAAEIVDQLEAIFAEQYARYLISKESP